MAVMLYLPLGTLLGLLLAEALGPFLPDGSAQVATVAGLVAALVLPWALGRLVVRRWVAEKGWIARLSAQLWAGAGVSALGLVLLPVSGAASFAGAQARAQGLWRSLGADQKGSGGAAEKRGMSDVGLSGQRGPAPKGMERKKVAEKQPPKVSGQRVAPQAEAESTRAAKGRATRGARPPQPTGFSFGPGKRERGWPNTIGLRWEQDPATALARGRSEGKPILVYVGSRGCPSCKRMETTKWRDPRVKEAAKRVVLLAIYRWGRGGGSSEWAVRLNVRGYPQLRWLDGWGRVLPVKVVRTVGSIVRGVKLASDSIRRAIHRPGFLTLPVAIDEALPAEVRDQCRSPNVIQRWAKWQELLLAKTLPVPAQLQLGRFEKDAVARLAVLERLRSAVVTPALVGHWAALVNDPNDYVRAEALRGLGRSGDTSQLAGLHGLLERINAGRSGLANRNNVRGDLIVALGKIADPSSLTVLEQTAQRVCGGTNANCRRVGEAAHRIWQAKRSRGTTAVFAAILQRCQGRPGHICRGDNKLALAYLGEVLGRDLLPAGANDKELAAAVSRARTLLR